MADKKDGKLKAKLHLGWHFDLHTPGYVRVNQRPDPDRLAKALKAAGVEKLITFAKCHFGYSYYPTKIGTPHPQLQGDLFGSVLNACRKQGIKVLAYISFGIDGQAGEKHPEWRQVKANGAVDTAGWFIAVCPFTGYTDELMLPQIEEIARTYGPDGLWFDTMSALFPCYCDSCSKAFLVEFGKEIPKTPDDPLFAQFGKWRHDRGFALVERIAAQIKRQLPNADIGFNQLGCLRYPEKMPSNVTVLSLDPSTMGNQSLQFSLNAAFGVSSGMPSEVMPTIFNHGWGDWSFAPKDRLEQVAVASWARGAAVYCGDRLHPENRMTQATEQALKFVGRLKQKAEKIFPPADAKAAPDILLLHSLYTLYGDAFENFAINMKERVNITSGAHQIFLDAGANFTVTSESFLNQWLCRVKVAVIPEVSKLDAESNELLRSFVMQGGKLLIAGRLPRLNGQPIDWAGIQEEGGALHDHIYIPQARKGDLPVLIRGDFYKHRVLKAQTIRKAIEPYDAQYGKRYGWGMGPSSNRLSEFPALTVFKLGRGEVWFLAAPIFSDYERQGDWQQVELIKELIGRIHRNPKGYLDFSSGGIELVLWENPMTTWAILIQHKGEELVGRGSWARTAGPAPVVRGKLNVAINKRKAKRISMNGKSVSFKKAGGYLQVLLTMDQYWHIVRIDWK